MHSVLPGILVQLKKELDINILLDELKNEEQAAAIIAGQIDIGFVRSVPERKDILATKVFTESFSPCSPIKASSGKTKKNKFWTLQMSLHWTTYDCAPKVSEAIVEICRKSGFRTRVVHETSQVNSIVRLVESGMGYFDSAIECEKPPTR